MYDTQDKDDFLNLFKRTKDDFNTVLIKVNGTFVVLKSGKSSWSSMGAAKCALVNHCRRFSRNLHAKYGYTGQRLEQYHDFIDKMEKDGVLEFVQVGN